MIYLDGETIEKKLNICNIITFIEAQFLNAPFNNITVQEPLFTEKNGITHQLSSVYGIKYGGIHSHAYHWATDASLRHENYGGYYLFNSSNQNPLAVIDSSALSGIRAGAVAAVLLKHLAPQDAKTMGLVGAGNLGKHILAFAEAAHHVDNIELFDQDPWLAEQAVEKLKKRTQCQNIHTVNSVEDLITNNQIIITATNSAVPVLPDDKPVLYGKTYIAAGSRAPRVRELPVKLFELLKHCFADTPQAIRNSGDLIEPLINNRFHIDNVISAAGLLKNPKKFKPQKTQLIKIAGDPVMDLLLAQKLFEDMG